MTIIGTTYLQYYLKIYITVHSECKIANIIDLILSNKRLKLTHNHYQTNNKPIEVGLDKIIQVEVKDDVCSPVIFE